jgi:hypothetical protein
VNSPRRNQEGPFQVAISVGRPALQGGAVAKNAKVAGKLFDADDTVTVTVSTSTDTVARRVFLGDTELQFNARGIGKTRIKPGTYSLFWVVFGANQQSYSIEIKEPDSAKWKPDDFKIDGNHDIGVHHPVVVK